MERAGCEYRIAHHHGIKDRCTIIELADGIFEEVREQNAFSFLQSGISVLPSTPRLDYLHFLNLLAAKQNLSGSILKRDILMLSLLQEISGASRPADTKRYIDKRLKERHLETIDRAKRYIIANFQRELSLTEIARNAYVSVFHFSRLFKYFTSRSPHQYLLDVRLEHAALLLRNTSLSVTEVCFESGFNSFEHFITTFTNRYSTSPSKYRNQTIKAQRFF